MAENLTGDTTREAEHREAAPSVPPKKKSTRGFASMSPERQREIARKGGKAAHAKGTAHEFSPDEARVAGRKGGEAVSRDRKHMAEIGREGGQARGLRASERKRAQQQGGNAEAAGGSEAPSAAPGPTVLAPTTPPPERREVPEPRGVTEPRGNVTRGDFGQPPPVAPTEAPGSDQSTRSTGT